MTQTHTFALVGKPTVEHNYCDEWETALSMTVRRSDGVEGVVWVGAGVPAHLRGTATAAGHQTGLLSCWGYGDAWYGDMLDGIEDLTDEDGWITEARKAACRAIIEAVEDAAIAAHQTEQQAA